MNRKSFLLVFGFIAGFISGAFTIGAFQTAQGHVHTKPSEFESELVARGLASQFASTNSKWDTLTKFAKCFMDKKDLELRREAWFGYPLSRNPWGIRIEYVGSNNTVISNENANQHLPEKGDVLRIIFGDFNSEFALTKSESEAVFYVFFGE